MKNKSNLSIFLMLLFIGAPFTFLKAQSWYKISNSIDLIVGVDIGTRIIDQKNNSQAARQEYENRSALETHKINYRIGINYMHGISKTFSIKTGLRLSNPGFSVLGVEDIDPNQNINTVEKQISSNQEGSVFKYGYQLVEIPLGLRYTLVKNTCEPFFELGISTNVYWRTKISRQKFNQRGYGHTTVQEKAINRLNYIGFLSVGGNINFTQKISGFSQLIARYQLNNFRESAIVERIVSLGLEFGIRRYL